MNFLKRLFKKPTEKELATERNEPWFDIIGFGYDSETGNGAFELDWNQAFVEEKRIEGFVGNEQEDVVDQWFNTICRSVAMETYEKELADSGSKTNKAINKTVNKKYINKKDIGDGRSEIS